MARSTMAALIARVRLLINDPSGASQVWADDDIQDDALLSIGPHDKAGKPATNAADDQPDNDTHQPLPPVLGHPLRQGRRSGITDA